MSAQEWCKRRIVEPLLLLLHQGLSPRRLALCVAIGIVVGNIPVLGVSTVLCTIIALALRLNLPAMQIAQAAMAPFQVLLIIPFVRLGEWMTGSAPQPLSIQADLALIAQGAGHAMLVLRDAILHAAIAWILVAPPAAWALYLVFVPVFVRASARFAEREATPDP